MLIVSASITVSCITPASSSQNWSVQQLPNGQWWYARYSSNVWAEDLYFTEDRSRILEHRYWDVYGRMIEVQYDEDGKPGKTAIRD